MATFDDAAGESLLMKVALSMTGADGAKRNLAADIPAWDFEGVRTAAHAKWNAIFTLTTCEGSDDQKRNWYTALYHLYGQPNDYADADGRFAGADGKAHDSVDGQYVHGNEPSHHVIYFYPQVGHPEKAAERIREVFDTQYHVGPEGLCGNDDCGQMSAWYLFSAMGFYPFDPCGGEYVIGAPQLPCVTLRLKDGKTFTVVAKNLSKENKYVKSVLLNGQPVTDWKLRHADIVKGGTLVFEMGAASRVPRDP